MIGNIIMLFSTGCGLYAVVFQMPNPADVAPPLNPQPLQIVNKSTSRNPPPLNIWHHSKTLGQVSYIVTTCVISCCLLYVTFCV